MSVPTITCPHCGQLHALYWVKNLATRNLKYLCNRYPKLRTLEDGTKECRRTVTEVTMDPELAKAYRKIKEIPERWSKKKIRREQSRIECDLRLDL